ncbi:MAG: hypothetical protein ACPGQD_06420 [Planctomycetota bacterium]
MSDGAATLAARFAEELARDRIADAYLLVGNAASALEEAAFACAATLLEAQGDVRQHADLVVFDPTELGVDGLKVEHIAWRKDEVPSLEAALRYRPVVGRHRAVLLFGADRMTVDAHAALLKTTEEPPQDTVLFFTARELHDLSPALRSRCRIWRVPQADSDLLRTRGEAAGLTPQGWDLLLPLYGSGEALLDAPEEDRSYLLGLRPRLQAWLEGEEDWSWCHLPEAGRLAEQRRLGILLLQAARAWLLATALPAAGGATPAWAPAWDALQVARLGRLDRALGDLQGQVSPGLVLDELRLGCPAENRIS